MECIRINSPSSERNVRDGQQGNQIRLLAERLGSEWKYAKAGQVSDQKQIGDCRTTNQMGPKGGEGIMGNASVAFADLGDFMRPHFPKVSEFENRLQYPASRIESDSCFEDIIGKGSASENVPEKVAIFAPSNSTLRAHGGSRTVCDIPLANLGRALALLAKGGTAEGSYDASEIEFLSQVAGQIAIAIDKAQACDEISEQRNKLVQEELCLEKEFRSEMGFERIMGSSPALRHVLQLVETVAPSDSTVLLLGETGTGKELIARAIHERSRRKERTFVKLNCAAIPTGLLESELFGHEKGAFTGAISQKVGRMELADHGTLFLDEVGDIPTEIQPKMLRALQEREFERLGSTHTRKVNLRVVAATNRDLEKMVADREFRNDLYYRLNVFPIRIPPLRERREDIPLLVGYFVQKCAKQMQKRIEAVPVSVMKGLTAWDWPGNIRELENFIERAVILTRGKSLEAPLGELRQSKSDEPVQASMPGTEDNIARIVKETIASLKGMSARSERVKKQHDEIVRALTECKGRVAGADGAAAHIGIIRTTLISRMKRLGINPYDYV
jgi:formate hydrogenlyase transcriptional activator